MFRNHIRNLQDDFNAWYKDLLNMEIPEWIISSFDIDVKSANLDIFLVEEFTEMTFDLEVKSICVFRGIGYYWMNEKTSKISQTLCSFY